MSGEPAVAKFIGIQGRDVTAIYIYIYIYIYERGSVGNHGSSTRKVVIKVGSLEPVETTGCTGSIK